MTLLAAQSLTIRIGGKPICRGLDLRLRPGEYWAVLGGNGIGKTTLLHTLAGLRRADGGGISVEGTALEQWNRKRLATRLGVLFQDSTDTFPCSVLETVLTGRYPHTPFWSVAGSDDFERAARVLAAVELAGMEERQVDTLSGGERRRLAVAALLMQEPRIWLLDEPSNHLDLRHQVRLLALMTDRVRAADGGLLMTLHDVNLAQRFCTHALLMIDHENLLPGPFDAVVNEGNLERLYRCPVRCVADRDGRRFYYAA